MLASTTRVYDKKWGIKVKPKENAARTTLLALLVYLSVNLEPGSGFRMHGSRLVVTVCPIAAGRLALPLLTSLYLLTPLPLAPTSSVHQMLPCARC